MNTFSTFVWIAATSAALMTGSARASDSHRMKESIDTPGFHPKNGLVPNAKTAIAIAVAVWNPVYGEKEIAAEMPYSAVLENGQWTVKGSVPDGMVGGTATAVISKVDGRVLKIYHTK